MRAAGAGFIAMVFQNGAARRPAFGGTTGGVLDQPVLVHGARGHETRRSCSTSPPTAAAGNKILLARKRGDTSIPEGWANDEDGRPDHRSPGRVRCSQLQWSGGHKGFGLAMLVEIIAGVLADSCYGTVENTDPSLAGRERIAEGRRLRRPRRLALPSPTTSSQRRRRAHRRRPHVGAWRPAPSASYVPGELEAERRAQRLHDGIRSRVASSTSSTRSPSSSAAHHCPPTLTRIQERPCTERATER